MFQVKKKSQNVDDVGSRWICQMILMFWRHIRLTLLRSGFISALIFAGRKHSRIKSLKTLFRRRKKTSEEANAKLSQSASDVTAGKGLGSDEDLVWVAGNVQQPCSFSHLQLFLVTYVFRSFKGTMGSRALSHDSIFLDDQDLTDAEPARVLSQENVHGKIKALQVWPLYSLHATQNLGQLCFI